MFFQGWYIEKEGGEEAEKFGEKFFHWAIYTIARGGVYIKSIYKNIDDFVPHLSLDYHTPHIAAHSSWHVKCIRFVWEYAYHLWSLQHMVTQIYYNKMLLLNTRVVLSGICRLFMISASTRSLEMAVSAVIGVFAYMPLSFSAILRYPKWKSVPHWEKQCASSKTIRASRLHWCKCWISDLYLEKSSNVSRKIVDLRSSVVSRMVRRNREGDIQCLFDTLNLDTNALWTWSEL